MLLAASQANAAPPYTVQITSIEMNNNGLYLDGSGNPAPGIFIRVISLQHFPVRSRVFSSFKATPS
jgi:hypothetical protein